MTNFNTVAVLGSTGYIGLELVKILLKHSAVKIVFLGSENSPNQQISTFRLQEKLSNFVTFSDICVQKFSFL